MAIVPEVDGEGNDGMSILALVPMNTLLPLCGYIGKENACRVSVDKPSFETTFHFLATGQP
jgi:hypothetical protein